MFTGTIFCPNCGAEVTMTAEVGTSGVRRDGKHLRASLVDARGDHQCPKRRA